MSDNSINDALHAFEASEANLAKLESLWSEITGMIPEGLCYGDSTDGIYEERCREFAGVHEGLPKIDDWELPLCLLTLNEIAQFRFDAMETGEIECKVAVEDHIYKQKVHLAEYRHRLNKKRRQLVREKVIDNVEKVDCALEELIRINPISEEGHSGQLSDPIWQGMLKAVSEIDALLGSSVKRPKRWSDLLRHMSFGYIQDLHDIQRMDWPAVQEGLLSSIYGASDPIPTGVDDLGSVVSARPTGDIVTQLEWERLDDSAFERLLFSLFSKTPGYENAAWSSLTNAPDRGRDISVIRIHEDALGGTLRLRVIVQCKHWRKKSIRLSDVVSVKEQMKLWEPPRVDVLIIASSGRFTTDAIDYIEKHNQSDIGMRIEMWPESHIESLLASRPALIAEFDLR